MIGERLQHPLGADETLFFMHIPKTAGMSLISILDQRYTADEICPLHDSYRKFLAYTPEERARFRFIRGHFPYSLKDQLPRPPRLLTFLRHPVARVLSAVNQHRRNEQQGVSFFEQLIGDISLEEFLRHPRFGEAVQNVAVKYLNDILMLGYKQRKPLSLELAKERLETFDVIGLVEEFEQSLELLAYTFGFPPILEVPYVNVDPQRASRQAEVKQNILDYIAETNREEMELYEYAQKLFRERVKRMRAEQAQEKRKTIPENLSTAVFFDFRRVNPGRGWHVGEVHPVYGVIRWSGPGPAYLEIPIAGGQDLILRVQILLSLRRLFRYPHLEVNGQPVPLRPVSFEKGMLVYQGRIPSRVVERSPGVLHLVFSVGGPSIPFLERLPVSEQRRLGLCYHSLSIEPASP